MELIHAIAVKPSRTKLKGFFLNFMILIKNLNNHLHNINILAFLSYYYADSSFSGSQRLSVKKSRLFEPAA